MKIYPISDVHLDHNGKIHRKFNFQPDPESVVVVAGDIVGWSYFDLKKNSWGRTKAAKPLLDDFIQYLSERCRQVIVVLGNHDYNGTIIDIDSPTYWDCDTPNVPRISDLYDFSSFGNVKVLHRGNWIVVDDVVFVGATLWTDVNKRDPFSLILGKQWLYQDFHHTFVRRGMNPLHSQEACPADWAKLHDVDKEGILNGISQSNFPTTKKVVVVTHMLPFTKSVHEKYRGNPMNAFFACTDMDQFAEEGIKLWIHGHTHDACDYSVGDMRVICNPFGVGNQFTRNDFVFDLEVEV